MKYMNENAIDEILEDVTDSITKCAVITGQRPIKDCDISCQYRHICIKIFKLSKEYDK